MYPMLIKRIAHAGLRSNVGMDVKLTVPVLRAAAEKTFVFSFTCYILPTNPDGTTGTKRLATANEVSCHIQFAGGFSAWTDTDVVPTDANGQAKISLVQSRVTGHTNWRATAKAYGKGPSGDGSSQAEIGALFSIDASGNISSLGTPFTIGKGSTLPATFYQERFGDRSFRNLAIPETRVFPFAGLHQTRGLDIAFPEVRQWTRTGTEQYLPGRVIGVRQSPSDRRPSV